MGQSSISVLLASVEIPRVSHLQGAPIAIGGWKGKGPGGVEGVPAGKRRSLLQPNDLGVFCWAKLHWHCEVFE